MKKLLTLLVSLGIAAVPAVSLAAYVAGGQIVALPAVVPTSSNAYLAGATVDATSPVSGDLAVVGGTIIVSSAVKQDILAAGGTINIIGASAEDLRVAGGNVTIDGKFSGEVMAGGGNITVTADTTIAKDSYFGAGTLDFLGTENGALTVVGGNVHINGTVNGNLSIPRAGAVTIGPNAIIKGNFEYSGEQQATIEQGAQITGRTTFHQTAASATDANRAGIFAAILGFWLLAKFFTVLTAAYLLWYLRRKDMMAVIEATRTKFWKKILVGFILLFLVPIAVIILFVTIIGIIPAIVALLAYALFLVLAAPIAVIMTASILMALFKKSMTDLRWYHILIGTIIYGLLWVIPVIGWIAGALIYLASLGALAGVLGTKFAD